MGLLLALAASAPAQNQATGAPEIKTYSSGALGLAFDYPASWQVAAKGEEAVFTMPLASGSNATLELFASEFRGTTDEWQQLQTTINNQLRRTVERQWQEEILGVPLLMTRIQYSKAGQPTSTLIGLMYSATPKKLHFRLTSLSPDTEAAEQALRSVLPSLRTNSGDLPTAQDPSAPTPTPEQPKVETKPPPPPKVLSAAPRSRRIEKAPVSVPVKLGEQALVLRLPAGWTAVQKEGGFALANPKVEGGVMLNLAAAEMDMDPTLQRAAATTLSQFSKISQREEPRPWLNRAGQQVSYVRRTGSINSSDEVVLQAIGGSKAGYWLIDYRAAPKTYASERRLLHELFDRLSLEPAS